MMKHVIAFATTLVLLSQAPAHAQAVRTFVAANGNDAAVCSGAAPCRTFAGAIAKTAAGGVISCVNAADYGAVTIAKSISIVCDNTQAGITTTAVGITVATAASDTVTLSGLDLEGGGAGTSGIAFTQGGTLHVHNVRIRGFRGGGGFAFGISVTPTAAVKLDISESVISESGSGYNGAALTISTTGPVVGVSIWKTRMENNRIGLRVFGSPTALNVTAADSTFTGNGTAVMTGGAAIMLQNAVISNNQIGISNGNPGGQVRIGNSVVTGNGTGISTVFGAFTTSYKNNQIRGNGSDGTPLAAETAE